VRCVVRATFALLFAEEGIPLLMTSAFPKQADWQHLASQTANRLTFDFTPRSRTIVASQLRFDAGRFPQGDTT
jgi:hypothetical protein